MSVQAGIDSKEARGSKAKTSLVGASRIPRRPDVSGNGINLTLASRSRAVFGGLQVQLQLLCQVQQENLEVRAFDAISGARCHYARSRSRCVYR